MFCDYIQDVQSLFLYCMSSAGTARRRSPVPQESLGATRVWGWCYGCRSRWGAPSSESLMSACNHVLLARPGCSRADSPEHCPMCCDCRELLPQTSACGHLAGSSSQEKEHCCNIFKYFRPESAPAEPPTVIVIRTLKSSSRLQRKTRLKWEKRSLKNRTPKIQNLDKRGPQNNHLKPIMFPRRCVLDT